MKPFTNLADTKPGAFLVRFGSRKLHLGSDAGSRDASVNGHDSEAPSRLVGNVLDLSDLLSSNFDEIIVQDLIGLIPWWDIPLALLEWNRLLATGGTLDIRGAWPNIMSQLFCQSDNRASRQQLTLVKQLLSRQLTTGDYRLTGFAEPLIRFQLWSAGFQTARVEIKDEHICEVWARKAHDLYPPELTAHAGNDAEFVEAAYQAVLQREVDAGGSATWVGQLGQGTLSRVSLVRTLVFSEENQNRLMALYPALRPAFDPDTSVALANMGSPFPMTPAQAYTMMYGASPSPGTLDLLHQRGAAEPVSSLKGVRRLMMALDRNQHLSPAILRFDPADLFYAELDGFNLAIDTDDVVISAHIAADRVWERALTGIFRRYLRPGWRVADIGANIGYFSMLARSLVGPDGAVLAFEPNAENARLILQSIGRNGYTNVALFPVALSDKQGHTLFSSQIGSNGGLFGTGQELLAELQGTVVATMRLDDLVQGSLDFIKMDTEGAEGRIMRGAQRILSTSHPIVSTELSCEMLPRVSGVSPRDYLGLFASHRYAIHRIDVDTHHIEPVGDIDAYLANWGNPGRIDDLLMLPAGTPLLQA